MSKCKMQFFNGGFYSLKGKGSKPPWPHVKKVRSPLPGFTIQLQSSICDEWQWVFHIADKEFCPIFLC